MLFVVLFGVLMIAHGLIHVLWLTPAPADPKWPFTTSHSPLLPFASASVLRPLAWVLVVVIVAGYVAAALGLFGVPGLAAIWGKLAIGASVVSLIACAIFWNNQFVTAPILDIAIIVAVVMGWPKAG